MWKKREGLGHGDRMEEGMNGWVARQAWGMVARLYFTVNDYCLVSIIRMRPWKWGGLKELAGVNWFDKAVRV